MASYRAGPKRGNQRRLILRKKLDERMIELTQSE